jgi:hypothetical protein
MCVRVRVCACVAVCVTSWACTCTHPTTAAKINEQRNIFTCLEICLSAKYETVNTL